MKKENNTSIKIKVLFEEPFYIGIFERMDNKKIYAAKVTFGKEPKEQELNSFLNENYYKLKWQISDEKYKEKDIKNPKRKQREAKRDLSKKTIGTKSQNAIKKQYEENKEAKKKSAKERKDLKEKVKFEIRQNKRKEKHKGH